MNENNNFNLQLEIDRLVGGELDKPAQRQLVDRLDSIPDGWRCCALAYMEAQSWKAAFGSILVDAETDVDRTANAAGKPRSTDDNGSPRQLQGPTGTTSRVRLILATSIAVVAFAAGLGVSAFWNRPTEEVGPGRLVDDSGKSPAPRVAAEPQPVAVANDEVPANEGLVGLVSVSNNGVTESAFAVVGGEDFDGPPPQFSQPLVADYVRQVWRRKGYAIEQHRKVVSVKLKGGRRLDFPIDWVNYRYVGQQVF